MAPVARAEGAQVLITEVGPYRRELTMKCGFTNILNPAEEDVKSEVTRIFGADGYDVGFECVGVPATIDDAITTIGQGGTIIVVGVFGERPKVNIVFVSDRELNLRGTLMYKVVEIYPHG